MWDAFSGLATLRVGANAFKIKTNILACEIERIPANDVLVSGRKLFLGNWRPSQLPGETLEAAQATSEKAPFLTWST